MPSTFLLWKHWYMSFDVSGNAWNCLIFTVFCKNFLAEDPQTPLLIQIEHKPIV